ncbi:MAG: ABC transporter substrate-binding protein [Erysipelotrichaceae bacterium]|nr:ABC transporter substrate-binding protein [Erysipelotrichaceae bacterium]
MKKLLIVLFALLLLVGCSSEKGGDEKDKVFNVGVLQLIQHDALDKATKGFEDALKDKLGDKVVFDEQNASGDSANCAVIANQFVANDVDLIFANATPALQAAATATDTIPVVATSVTSFAAALNIDNWTGMTGTNVTGTSDLAVGALEKQAAQIVELLPEAKKVAVFYCSAEPNSVAQADEIEGYLDALGLEHQRFTFSDSNDIAQVAVNACEWADVVFVPTDNAVASYASEDQFSKPVIAGEEGICKRIGVATVSLSYYQIGYKAGEMAADILINGTDPATLPVVEESEMSKMYNPSIAAKFGIEIPSDYIAVE